MADFVFRFTYFSVMPYQSHAGSYLGLVNVSDSVNMRPISKAGKKKVMFSIHVYELFLTFFLFFSDQRFTTSIHGGA